ncbi:MAG TPA: serine hydrolase domain-containing protein [Streptosporangiaceae bacterium]
MTTPVAGAGRAALGARLQELITAHGVVGASAGIWRDGQLSTWSAGLASRQTGDPVTPSTLFHAASITKVLTAALTLQLVGEGLISLDQPVSSLLPELAFLDAAGPVTIRNLLTHTSGIDADFHLDTGRGDDALSRFASQAGGIGRPYSPGCVFSYGNAGYGWLGRVAEVVASDVWDRQLRRRILSPLGMTRTTTTPEQALRWPFAVGHVRTPGGRVLSATTWPFFRSVGPAGILCTTAGDMLRFASAFAVPPAAGRRDPIMPASLMADMQAVTVRDVHSAPEDHWGLGWGLYRCGSARVLAHDGGTKGYESFLRVFPGAGTAVVLLTNGGGDAGAVFHEMFGPLLQQTCDGRLPLPAAPGEPEPGRPLLALALSDLAGIYDCGTWRLHVTGDPAAVPGAVLRLKGLAADEMGTRTLSLDVRPAGDGRFEVGSGGDRWPLHLVQLPDGTRLAHMWRRAARKVGNR